MKNTFYPFAVLFAVFSFSCKQNPDNFKEKQHTAAIEKYSDLIKIDIPKSGIPFKMGLLDEKSEVMTNSFEIGKYEVTFGLWHTVSTEMIKKGYTFFSLGRTGGSNAEPFLTGENRYKPVSYVSWFDAVVWCNAYSEYSGLTPVYSYNGAVLRNSKEAVEQFKKGKLELAAVKAGNSDGYRLPYEAEWEFAARFTGNEKPSLPNFIQTGQDSVTYYFTKGNAMSGCFSEAADNEESGGAAWFQYNSGDKTHTVGEKKANFLCCFDMSGNAAEWCFDGDEMQRLNKGGAYNLQASGRDYMKIGFNMFKDFPDICMDFIGFRVARSLK